MPAFLKPFELKMRPSANKSYMLMAHPKLDLAADDVAYAHIDALHLCIHINEKYIDDVGFLMPTQDNNGKLLLAITPEHAEQQIAHSDMISQVARNTITHSGHNILSMSNALDTRRFESSISEEMSKKAAIGTIIEMETYLYRRILELNGHPMINPVLPFCSGVILEGTQGNQVEPPVKELHSSHPNAEPHAENMFKRFDKINMHTPLHALPLTMIINHIENFNIMEFNDWYTTKYEGCAFVDSIAYICKWGEADTPFLLFHATPKGSHSSNPLIAKRLNNLNMLLPRIDKLDMKSIPDVGTVQTTGEYVNAHADEIDAATLYTLKGLAELMADVRDPLDWRGEAYIWRKDSQLFPGSFTNKNELNKKTIEGTQKAYHTLKVFTHSYFSYVLEDYKDWLGENK